MKSPNSGHGTEHPKPNYRLLLTGISAEQISAEEWRESNEKLFRDGGSKLANASPLTTSTETTVTRPTFRASFEVNLCPILSVLILKTI